MTQTSGAPQGRQCPSLLWVGVRWVQGTGVSSSSLTPLLKPTDLHQHCLPLPNIQPQRLASGDSPQLDPEVRGLPKTRFGGTVFEMEVISDRPGLESQTYFLNMNHRAFLLISKPLFFLLFSGYVEMELVSFL